MSSDWAVRGCWIGFLEVPSGTTGTVVVNFSAATSDCYIQAYSVYGLTSMTEQFSDAITTSSGSVTAPSRSNIPWHFVFISAACSDAAPLIYVNGETRTNYFGAQTVSNGYGRSFGVVATNFNTGTFLLGVQDRVGSTRKSAVITGTPTHWASGPTSSAQLSEG